MNNVSQEQLQEVMNDPQGMGKKNGYSIPENMRDPREMVQHLIMTGQVSTPLLQRVMPLIQRMQGK